MRNWMLSCHRVGGHAETYVPGCAVRSVPGAGMDFVALTIRGMTQMRAALQNLLNSRRSPLWIVSGAGADFGWAEPVNAPFPDIAGHIVEPVAVWRVSVDGRRPGIAVFGAVEVGKVALPYVV